MILVAVALLAPAPSAVLATVTQTYAKVKQLRADFTQTVTNTTFGTKQVTNGTIKVARPSNLRWDYAGKTGIKESYISDGTTLWLINNPNLTIHQMPVGNSTLPATLAFLTGNTSAYTASFNTSGTYGGKGATVLDLVPKAASTVAHLLLVVDPATGQVSESVVIDSQSNIEDFLFSNTDLTTPIPAATITVPASPSSTPSPSPSSTPSPSPSPARAR